MATSTADAGDPDQGGSHRRPDGPALVRGARQRQRGQDGHRRHQRQGRPAGAAASSCTSRTARRTTPSRPPRRRSSSSTIRSTSSSAASTAPRGRPSRGRPSCKGRTLYIYPEQYEGQESDPLIFCTGPVPAQQVDPFIPWLMRETGAKTFYLPSADYIWPHVMNARVREVVTANGGSIVGEEYFPLDHTDYRETVERIASSGADVVFNTIVPPGRHAVLRAAARLRLHAPRRAARLHVLRRELPEHGAGRARRGAVQLPRLLPGRRRSVQPEAARAVRRALSRRRQVHRRQRVLGPVPRAAALGGGRDGGRLARPGRT